MNDNRIIEKWKKEILLFKDKYEFQNLCQLILEKEGFQEVIQRGKGGDNGRDLQGIVKTNRLNNITMEKCWFQCKNQSSEINIKQISSDISNAEGENVDRYYIISNMGVSSNTIDYINKYNKSHRLKIDPYYTGQNFITTYWKYPKLCEIYTKGEKIPSLTDEKQIKLKIEEFKQFEKTYEIEVPINFNENINNMYDLLTIIKKSHETIKKLKNYDKIKIYQKFSEIFLSQGNNYYQDSKKYIDMALNLEPNNIDSLLVKATIYDLEYNTKSAKKIYKQITQINKDNIYGLLGYTNCLKKESKFGEALKVINQIQKKNSQNIMSIKLKSEILRLYNKPKKAYEFLRNYDKVIKNYDFLKNELVMVYIDLLDLKRAYEENKKLIQKNQNNSEYLNNMGVIFDKNSRYTNNSKQINIAQNYFDKAIYYNKEYAIAWSNKLLLAVNNDDENITKIIEDIIYNNLENNPYVIFQKIRRKYKEGIKTKDNKLIKSTLREYDKLIKDQFDIRFVFEKVKVYIQLRKYKEANNLLEKINEYNNYSEWWYSKYELTKKCRILPHNKEYYYKMAEKYKPEIISLLDDNYE